MCKNIFLKKKEKELIHKYGKLAKPKSYLRILYSVKILKSEDRIDIQESTWSTAPMSLSCPWKIHWKWNAVFWGMNQKEFSNECTLNQLVVYTEII